MVVGAEQNLNSRPTSGQTLALQPDFPTLQHRTGNGFSSVVALPLCWPSMGKKMEQWTQALVERPTQGMQVMDWWEKELVHLPKKTRKVKAAFMIYTTWNIWKERNRRVFEQKVGSPVEVLHAIKMEINERRMACGKPELPFMLDD